ncbi:MAG: stringent starvation protein A [Gammaproteobacteria bacterium]|jgi:RNA polymerase-associated protein|nr:stringent starvation protein A [Gammaproteobacteria bacterium]|tara:strand:- start:623 stop:1264 length:642 start_codon:yes stop_codon:yes gene_type:complete
MISLSKRTSMALFSDPTDHYCHRVRIVLAEKGISSEMIESSKDNIDPEILEISPYATLPVLVDRDVCLFDSVTLMEYLDERFPHPPLLPVYPVLRANIRLYIKRIELDWGSRFDQLADGNLKEAQAKKVRQELKSLVVSSCALLKEKPFFMNDEFSLVDCCIAPMLWRLPSIGIEIPNDAKHKPLNLYMKRVFTMPSFIESLTELEREMREVS